MRLEQYNLIESEEHEDRITEMRESLFERLEEMDGIRFLFELRGVGSRMRAGRKGSRAPIR